MAITSNPYLSFPNDNTREAMTFYGSVFGAEPMLQPMQGMPGMPDQPDKIMHSELRTPEITLMAADSFGVDKTMGNAYTVALMAGKEDEARARELFDKLAEGGKVTCALEKQPWGDLYGDLTDKFGVQWCMNVGQ